MTRLRPPPRLVLAERQAGARRPPALAVVLAALVLALVPMSCSDDARGPTAPEPPEADEGAAEAVEGGEITESTGDGRAWQPLLEPGVGGRLTDLAFDPTDTDRILAAGATSGVGVSTDGGRTWRPAAGLTGWEVSALTWHAERPGEVWAATTSGPQVSLDRGETWELRRSGFPEATGAPYPAAVERVLVDPSDGDRLLAFGGSLLARDLPGQPMSGTVWESRDAGRSWQPLAELGGEQAVSGATFLAGGVSLLASSPDRGVFRSTDGGRTWQPSTAGLPHGNVASLVADPLDRQRAWVALDAAAGLVGGMYRTDDGGRTWRAADGRLPVQRGATPEESSRFGAVAVAPSEPDVLYTSDLATGRRAVFRSEDGGDTWARLAAPPPAFYQTEFSATVLAVAADDADRVLLANEESLFASDDGGESWADIAAVPLAEGHQGTGLSALVATDVAFAHDGSLALQGTGGASILIRRPDGAWGAPLRDWDPWHGGYHLSIIEETWWALLGQDGTFNGLARSTDNGLTWDVLEGGDLPGRGQSLRAGPSSVLGLSDTTALVSLGGALHRTDDGGTSWTRVTDEVQGALVSSPVRPDVVFGSGPTGVHRSVNGGESFRPMPGSPPAAADLAVDRDGRLYAVVPSGPSAGLWRFDRSWRRILERPHLTDVAVDPGEPDHLLLGTGEDPAHQPPPPVGVLESVDGGKTWSVLDRGLPVTHVATVEIDPSGSGLVVAGTAGAGFFRLAER